MSTPRQIEANRINSQKSTGPKTEAGKAASSQNRLSHGFASTATIMPGEDPAEFKALLDDFTTEYQPATSTEQVLVEKMAVNQCLSLRAFRLQGYAFLVESADTTQFVVPKDLGLLIRYHSTAERNFHKAHNELVKAQKERKKSEIGFVPQDAAQSPDTRPSPVAASAAGFPTPAAVPTPEIVTATPEFFKKAA